MQRAARSALSREQRRAHLEQVALGLFRSTGFDRVTVEEICGAAGVAPATFYRYFGTKEDVVFAYRDAFMAALRTAIDAAAGLQEPARLASVITTFAEHLESQRDLLAPRDDIVLGNPRLLQYTLMIQRDWEGALADGLARLRGLPGPDASARLEAALGILVLRMGVRSWRVAGGGTLPAAVRDALASVRSLVCGWPEAGPAPDGPPDVSANTG
jgi:AcrR family transcriptional regulator